MEFHEEQRAPAHYLCKGCLNVLNPQLPQYCTAPLVPRDRSSSCPRPCAGRGSNCPRGNSTCMCEERTAAQTAPGFLFPLHVLSKVFICPLLTGKQVGRGQSLSHPGSRCCSGRGFLTVLVGSMLGVRVGSPPMDHSCLTAGRAPCQPAVGSSTSHLSAVPQGNTTPWEHQSLGHSCTESPWNDSAAGSAGQQALPTAAASPKPRNSFNVDCGGHLSQLPLTDSRQYPFPLAPGGIYIRI